MLCVSKLFQVFYKLQYVSVLLVGKIAIFKYAKLVNYLVSISLFFFKCFVFWTFMYVYVCVGVCMCVGSHVHAL